jgi:hypothetical protein
MKQPNPEQEKIRKQIDGHAMTLLSWAAMFEAMDQETPATLKLQSYAMGEAARSIQHSVLAIQELVDTLADGSL